LSGRLRPTEITMVTSVSWVSQRKLGDLTLSCTPGLAPHPCPLSDISLPPPHHPTPTARPPAPPRCRLLYSRRLPELLHAPPVLSPGVLPRCLSLSLSNTGLRRTPLSPVGTRGQPCRRLRPGCLPARRRSTGSCPLHRFLGHQP
jgi:hypothetical protein